MFQVRLRIGMYYPFIADWLRVFPRDQIKVVRYEDYISRPSEIINEVCKFLEIREFDLNCRVTCLIFVSD